MQFSTPKSSKYMVQIEQIMNALDKQMNDSCFDEESNSVNQEDL